MLKRETNLILFSLTCLFILTACNGGSMADQKVILPSIKDVPASAWAKLAEKKIYFGHQSVGYNIMEGEKDLMKEYSQIKLNVIETTDPSDFDRPIFGHSRNGANADPKSKTQAFTEFIRKDIGDKVDIAFFKFCYVDIGKGADFKSVFKDYKTKMAQLEKDYPSIIFIHITVPLVVTKTSWKTWVKEVLGRGDLYEYAGNIERNEYNDLVRKEYEGKAPLFDLARIESTYPDGTRSTFSSRGKAFSSLVPEYTKDGGHLNEQGREVVAEQLLILLAHLANK